MAVTDSRSGHGPAIARLHTGERAFEVQWSDGHESVFHFVWLRFNCACETCGDLDSGIGTVMMADIPEDVSPREARVDERGGLRVVWDHDGHGSRFEPGDILAYDNQRVIHGRTPYDDSRGARHLRSVEVSREEFHNRLRLLMTRLRRPEARSITLARGALA